MPRPGPIPLGELETAVMEHVWAGRRADVKSAWRAIGVPRGITLNTVQSTLERLWRKGLLDRVKESHAFVYAARVTREEFGSRILMDVVSGILGGRTATMLAAFVDVADRAGEDDLRRLEQLVAERLAQREGGR
jgi:predicted transcriptional regulator